MRMAHSEHHDELQKEAILGRIGSDSHDPHGNAHALATRGGRPGAIQLRTSLHPAWAAEREYS
jgi:hypothetical protein